MHPTFPMLAPVIVDGNRHRLGKRIQTKLESPITIIKCRDIVRNLESEFGIKIGKIEVHLYDSPTFHKYYEQVENGELSPSKFAEYYSKTARYNVAEDCLQIWKNDAPIYENNKGIICNDLEALADCLL